MEKGFPFSDVTILKVKDTSRIDKPLFADDRWQISQHEFYMHVIDVADFFVKNGNRIEIAPAPRANSDQIKTYLTGEVMAALLHQRKNISFHASAFVYNESGIMILGSTGAGKSSLAAAFSLDGARFIADDLTRVTIQDGIPFMWPLNKSLKLRKNAISQLSVIPPDQLKADMYSGKYLLDTKHCGENPFSLNIAFKLEKVNIEKPVFEIPGPADKFSILRSEICSWEMLQGMPQTESEYFRQLITISEKVRLVRLTRPPEIKLSSLHEAVRTFIDSELS